MIESWFNFDAHMDNTRNCGVKPPTTFLFAKFNRFLETFLNSKQGISWHSLVPKQDFSWKFWFHMKTVIQKFWIWNKTFVVGVWFRSKTFLHNVNLNARLSFKHFEFETRILLVEFGFATRLLLTNSVSLQDIHSNILNSKQGFCWRSLV